MSWLNSTKEEIKFIAPSARGNNKKPSLMDTVTNTAKGYFGIAQSGIFIALWRGNERSGEKKLGVFSIPGSNGDVIQDLSSKSISYPFTVYFNGSDHQSKAEAFSKALQFEVGQWEIIHPTKGSLILQLSSWKETISPVDDANTTVFDTQWLEPANIEKMLSSTETADNILSKISDLKDAAGDMALLAKQIRADSYAAIQSFVNTLNKSMGFTDSIMLELTATNALKQESYTESRNSFNNVISLFGVNNSDASDVAVAVADVMLSEVGNESDFTNDYPAFSEIIDDVLNLAPTTTNDKDYNKAIGIELIITASLMALAQSIIVSTYYSRSDIISAMDNITNVFNDTISAIDEIQNLFGYIDIDEQYYSMTQTYTSMMNLYAQVMNYLIQQFYNLKAEKILVLKNKRSPIEIAVTEYGSLGLDDENYDLLISSNQLSGDEILICPVGKEIRIYVQ